MQDFILSLNNKTAGVLFTDESWNWQQHSLIHQTWLKSSLGVLLTSDKNVGGFLCGIAHVVTGHAAVNASIFNGDGRYGEGSSIEHTLFWQLFRIPYPRQGWVGLPSGDNADQCDRLARVGHDGVFHQ